MGLRGSVSTSTLAFLDSQGGRSLAHSKHDLQLRDWTTP
jgi:hypothetical protein